MTSTSETSQRPSAASRVQLFETDGTRIRFEPGEWREDVMPAEVAAAWDNPDRLRMLAELSAEDGLDHTALLAATRLTALRPTSGSCACLLARVLQRANDVDGAKRELENHIEASGGSARVLATLSQLYTASGAPGPARKLLRRSLALDPNDKGTLARWCELHRRPSAHAPFGTLGNGNRKLEGPPDGEAVEACLVDITGESGAWRAQLELGRLALVRGEDAIAVNCFRSAIARSGGNDEATHGVAYALADAGRIDDLVAIARELSDLERSAPEPDPDVNRIFVGLKEGRAIIDDLLERELPLLAHNVDEIETSLDPEEQAETDADGQLVLEFAPGHAAPPRPARRQRAVTGDKPTGELRAFSYRGPLWGRLLREALALLPVKHPASARVTCFAASDAASSLDPTERHAESERALQVAMLPLFLTELLSSRTEARADCSLPYDDQQGLLQQVSRYSFDEMRAACEAEESDYLVSCHSYRDLGQSWLELIVWDIARKTQVAELRRSVTGDLGRAMQQIGDDLLSTLREEAGVGDVSEPTPISMPATVDLAYLSALADLLDLALSEVGIPPGTDCTRAQRYARMLALASQPHSAVVYRIMALAAFAEIDGADSSVTGDSLRALLQARDHDGQSLASLLPTLAPRLATR
ncbi:MAG: Flp pilus assembly protein TadD [Chlamydiales bacterium]|jgi:Flp pilus assembly protein TadD